MLYQPRDQSEIYLRALDARLRQIQNPYAQVPQAVGQFTQNLTAMGAHKNISDYLSLPDEEKAKPENKQRFYQSSILLGVDPSKFIAQKVDPMVLEKQKEAGRIAAIDEAARVRPSPADKGARQRNTDSENRKIVTNYAAKNRVSLDALRPGGMGGWNSSNLAMAADMIRNNPNYDMGQMKIDFAQRLSGATTSGRTAASIRTNLDSAHGGFIKSMELAKPLTGKFDIGAINQIINSGGKGLNDPDAIQLYAHLYAAANNFARMAKGGSASLGEQDTRDALRIISARLNAGGIEAVEKAAEAEYQGRLQGANESLGKSGSSSNGGWSYVGPVQ